ncbi:MAG: AMP-binding protein [Acidobacteria bacterium]|nr:AMP-binding protein [Acidobacteriota bacterium]
MESHTDSQNGIVWRPTPEQASRSRLAAFMKEHSIASFDELLRRSTEDIEWFWDAVIRDLDIQFFTPYQKIVDTSEGEPWARWCVGGSLNIIHNCLDKRIGTPDEKRAALRWEGEDGSQRTLTYGELHRETGLMAAALRRLGVRKGDVIAVFMPMTPEIAVAMFAASKVGAIALPLFSGYGPEAVASRLVAGGAKVLFTADGFYRRGQTVAVKEIADRSITQAGSSSVVETVIVLKRTGQQVPWTEGRDLWWHELMAESAATAWTQTDEERQAVTATERTSAEDPMLLIYTSGTTGQPKGAVHTHCGFPIKAAQDMVHCLDVQAGDTVYWVTDMGWMMGPWLIYGTTLLGATMLLYEGAPDYPAADRLWEMVERHGVTILGISPTLVRSLMQHGDELVKRHDLSSLRVLGSTGEPWNPDPWNWFFHTVGGGRLPIINYSGGTEISGGILGGNLLLPLKPTAFSAAIPGMAVDVVNECGESVRGQVGELVIRKPWIGMTRGFWKNKERYIEAYWSRFPGMWTHGDWAELDSDGMWYILGRSDDTIKVAGKRLGPAEIESVLVSHEAVAEAGCVGVPDPLKGQEVVCFCVLAPGITATDSLREELRELVAQRLGKPLKPRTVKFVRDLPKTRNAKLMRRVIRAAYLNEPAGDLSSLENPSAVDGIREAQ